MALYINFEKIRSYLNGNIEFFDLKKGKTKEELVEQLITYKKYYLCDSKKIDEIISNIEYLYENSTYKYKYVLIIEKYINALNSEDKKEIEKMERVIKSTYVYKKPFVEYLDKYLSLYPDKLSDVEAIKGDLDRLFKRETQRHKINRYFNESHDIQDLLSIGNHYYIIQCLRKYKNEHKEKADEVDSLIELLSIIHKKEKEYVVNYEEPKYVKVINLYLNGKIDMNGLSVLGDKVYLAECLEKYTLLNPSKIGDIRFLLDNIDNIYSKVDNKNRQNTFVNEEILRGESPLEADRKLINDVFLSNLCIEEYCSKNRVLIKTVKRICLKYSKKQNEEDALIGNMILNRSNKEFLNKLKEDAVLYLTSEDADILDYLQVTGLEGKEFKNLMRPLVPKEVIDRISKNVDIHRLDPHSNRHVNSYVSRESAVNDLLVINGIEVSREVKEAAFNYLEENKFPLMLHKKVIKKYLEGKMELNINKKLVK